MSRREQFATGEVREIAITIIYHTSEEEDAVEVMEDIIGALPGGPRFNDVSQRIDGMAVDEEGDPL